MAAFGKGSDPGGGVTPEVPTLQLETRVERRRLSQARHRATLAGLFHNLRKAVYSQSDLTASKWQVLNKAKNRIQELERNLDTLLKLKESFHLEDGLASTLEEVKEEYVRMYCGNDSFAQNDSFLWCLTETTGKDIEEEVEEAAVREDEQEEEEEEMKQEDVEEEEGENHVELLASPDTLSTELMEFERYLSFYKQIMDLLTMNNIISQQEVTLPVVSAAISHLWQTFSEEKKARILQAWLQLHCGLPETWEGPPHAEDSGFNSQEANFSVVSTAQEILFEDVLNLTNFLDNNEGPSTSSPSSMLANCSPESVEKFHLYLQIINFFLSLCGANTELKQEEDGPVDDEMIMLRCMETFDDDEL
ncbi:stimulated by retinoic acid gene 8 protein homolog isoform X2 [Ochotona princeps]|uniref:stimulated by retinoic acid gene 8 protein homolog isoform X2 n=1 Tax=Ochotona princeps TaxID=9978 RepID=UPI0027153AC9|nr:stimulated by retinoic acid gene 8 protein homolog isoform X2 [Ochotona princeps]